MDEEDEGPLARRSRRQREALLQTAAVVDVPLDQIAAPVLQSVLLRNQLAGLDWTQRIRVAVSDESEVPVPGIIFR